ncbi:hypothetical protein CGCFRS4_v015752 [Colletotrichum fructicola]|nr:hypothetical protein CGCFRS4_v015752 [Colletotrichum fructicola]
MIISRKFTDISIARTAGCTPRTIHNIRANLECFGHTKAPSTGVGRRRKHHSTNAYHDYILFERL